MTNAARKKRKRDKKTTLNETKKQNNAKKTTASELKKRNRQLGPWVLICAVCRELAPILLRGHEHYCLLHGHGTRIAISSYSHNEQGMTWADDKKKKTPDAKKKRWNETKNKETKKKQKTKRKKQLVFLVFCKTIRASNVNFVLLDARSSTN